MTISTTNPQRNLYILCGLPGSGKSTWAKAFVQSNQGSYVVCRDSIRTMLGSGQYVFNKFTEPIIKEHTIRMIDDIMALGYGVIVDETNISKSKRAELIEYAKVHHYKPLIVFFRENTNNVINRMKGDSRGYTAEKWGEVIEGMKSSFEVPTEEECQVIEVEPWVG